MGMRRGLTLRRRAGMRDMVVLWKERGVCLLGFKGNV